MKLKQRVAVIGAGKIGQTLLGSMISSGLVPAEDIVATTNHEETLQRVAGMFPGLKTTLDNAVAVADADIVLICVKPQGVAPVLRQLRECLSERILVISTVASVPTRFFEKRLGKKLPVIRTMPNTPCLIRQGMTGIAAGRYVGKEHLTSARKIFDQLGRSVVLDEKHLDAVTGMSGCGPAFMYLIVEALAEGGVKVGLPRDVATLLAAQTMMGAGSMILQTGQHPALLKDAVTTPAGCTIDGILELEDGGLRTTLIKAVVRATRRATGLFPARKPRPRRAT